LNSIKGMLGLSGLKAFDAHTVSHFTSDD